MSEANESAGARIWETLRPRSGSRTSYDTVRSYFQTRKS